MTFFGGLNILVHVYPGRKVAIALSGGVDSAVAAALLQLQGFNLRGVHLRLSPLAAPPDRVEALAQYLGIPLTVLDLQAEFAREVLDYFVSEYARGRTPNPCVRCNATIKFGYLWDYLKKSGVTHLATGHYARRNPDDLDAPALFRGVDRRKDQSYFLSRLPLSLLPNLLFPLGQMTKEEVWRLSRQAGLPVRENQPESMELCFIPAGSYQDFLKARRGFAGSPGDFVDPRGCLLGRHRGWKTIPWGSAGAWGSPPGNPSTSSTSSRKPTGWCWDTGRNCSPRDSRPPA